MIDGDTALGQQFFHITVGQAVPQVPADRHGDHLPREPEASENRRRARGHHHASLPTTALKQRNTAGTTPVHRRPAQPSLVEVGVSPVAHAEGYVDGAVRWNVYRDLKATNYQLVGETAIETWSLAPASRSVPARTVLPSGATEGKAAD